MNFFARLTGWREARGPHSDIEIGKTHSLPLNLLKPTDTRVLKRENSFLASELPPAHVPDTRVLAACVGTCQITCYDVRSYSWQLKKTVVYIFFPHFILKSWHVTWLSIWMSFPPWDLCFCSVLTANVWRKKRCTYLQLLFFSVCQTICGTECLTQVQVGGTTGVRFFSFNRRNASLGRWKSTAVLCRATIIFMNWINWNLRVEQRSENCVLVCCSW